MQAELPHDVHGEVLGGHLPVINETDQNQRPLLATRHHAQGVFAQRFVPGNLRLPAEQQRLGDALVIKLGRCLEDAPLEARRVGSLQDIHHRHHRFLLAEFGQGLGDGDAGSAAGFLVFQQFQRALQRLRTATAQRQREIATALLRHVVVECLRE